MKHPDPNKRFFVCGLRTATQDEITSMIKYYRGKGYRVTHRTKLDNGKDLPYNGVMIVDKRRKYLL